MKNKKANTLIGEKSDDASKNTRRVRTINIILALVMAISLWAYVIGEVNPETENVISGVPLYIVGQQDLEKQGLAVITEINSKTTVIVKGKRNNVYKITASKLAAKIDISDCVVGENQVPVNVTAPDSISEAYAKDGSITVYVDKVVEESKNIEIAIGGKKNSGTEVEITSMSSNSVKVSGPSTYVRKVDSVVGVLNLESGSGHYSQKVSLTAVDKDGNKVEGVELEKSKVKVVAEETQIKTLSVPVVITGANEELYVYHVPENVNVRIKGNYSIIKDINELQSQPLDVSWVNENNSLGMAVNIPEGTTAVDSEGNPLAVENNVIIVNVDIVIETKNPIEEEQ